MKASEEFKATEDDEGSALIVLEKESSVLFDFSDYVKSFGYKAVTPTFTKSHPIDKKRGFFHGRWNSYRNHRLLTVGDMHKAESIFAFLHEIGHIRHESSPPGQELTAALGSQTKRLSKSRAISESERIAWAETIKFIREISNTTEVDFLEIFPDFNSFKSFMYVQLKTHRFAHEFGEITSSSLDNIFDDEDSEANFKSIQKLFDRGRKLKK